MNKIILTPIVIGVLASAVISGCSSSNKSETGEKKVCDYKIQGGNAVDVMFGTSYSNPSVKVTKEGKDVTFKLAGAVNTSKLGTYKVTYTGESCKNTQVRTVKVVPSSCTYKLTGDNPLQVILGDKFKEPGFDVKDINKKTITGAVTGTVDTSKMGDYALTYKAEGCKNSQTRKVQVVVGRCDYTLAGANPLILSLGDTYSDPGVAVKDSKKKTVTSTASGAVRTSTVGDYTVTYQGLGCSNTETRKVTVKSVIGLCTYDLKGDNPLVLTQGGAYQEPGVSIQGAKKQMVTGTTSGSVDTSKLGDNTITYKSDRCTNVATRKVKVVSADCSYALLGDDPLITSKGDTLKDPGVTVKDAAGSVVKSTKSGDVDTAKLGDYMLTYQGKDCANSQTRVVKVEMPRCVYTLKGDSPLEIALNSKYVDPGATIENGDKFMGVGAVDTKKVGQYVVNYKDSKNCGNSADRIVNVRALTNNELKDTILPGI